MKISLDGQWLFKADPEKAGVDDKWYAEETDRSEWQTVQVPNFWKEYPGLAAYAHTKRIGGKDRNRIVFV
ncbi:MAG: hypothetical protein O7D34_01525 [Ignavibacteria bacterium]|nr:hypothetical protein [Ignavibacteria bacterium]